MFLRTVHGIEVDTPTRHGPYWVPTRRPAESSGEPGKQFWRDLDKIHARAQDSAGKAWVRNPYGPSVPAEASFPWQHAREFLRWPRSLSRRYRQPEHYRSFARCSRSVHWRE